MRNRPAPKRHTLLRMSLLAAGLASLGVVIGKVAEPPRDPALDARLGERMMSEVFPIREPHETVLSALPADAASSMAAPSALEESAPRDYLLDAVEKAPATAEADEGTPSTDWRVMEVAVEKGDNLSAIFSRMGLSSRQLAAIMELGKDVHPLTRIRPGDTLQFRLSPDNDVLGLSYGVDKATTLNVEKAGDSFQASQEVHPLETRLSYAEGIIESSLYKSARQVGLPADMVLELAEIFGWKINFLTDVQQGDEFKLLYENIYKDGEWVSTGKILAAEFNNNGQTHRAVRYTAPDGQSTFYTPEGKSLKRGFLRYPVDFKRISSNFNPRRLHPIHREVRPHNGVDFAAPTGTPIKAAADGKITFAGWKRGYGKVIIIQHDGTYSTLYGHLSRFNDKLSQGSTVRQEQLIGYVGATGDATGPHLHYEFRINGVHKDPLKVALPEAAPITPKLRQDFLAQTGQLMMQLGLMAKQRAAEVASASEVGTATDSAPH